MAYEQKINFDWYLKIQEVPNETIECFNSLVAEKKILEAVEKLRPFVKKVFRDEMYEHLKECLRVETLKSKIKTI